MINLWINSETNALLPNWNAFGTTTLAPIKQGDKIAFDIHWVKSDPAGQFMEEVTMHPSSVLKVAVGTLSGIQTGGYFIYSYEGDSVEIPYDADVSSFPIVPPPLNYVYVEKNANTLINSLPSIVAAGGVVVSIVNQRTFRIVFNEVGARELSSCDSTTLVPSTNISVVRMNNGDATTKEVQHLRPKRLPVAYSDSFTNSPQPTISILDIDSITSRISISPAPKFGTFTISNGVGTTSALSVNASAGDIISGLITAGISSSTRGYSVAKSGDYSWDIYRTSGTAESLTVSTNGLVGFSSKTGIVDFNTIEVEDLLSGQQSVTATLEVEYSFGSVKQTLYQGRVTIVNDIIDDSTYNPIPFPEIGGGIDEAPTDGTLYARRDGAWVSFQEEDNQGITQAFADGRYAQLSTGYATESWVTSQNYITSSALTGYATESWVSGLGYLTISDYPINAITSSYYYNYGTSLSLSGEITYYDGFAEVDITQPYTMTTPSGADYSGWTVTLDDGYSAGYINISGTSVTLGCNASTMQDACSALSSGVGGWVFTMSGSPYAPSSVLSMTIGPFTIPQTTLIDSPEQSFVIRGAMLKTITDEAKAQFAYNRVLATDSAGVAYFTDEYVNISSLSSSLSQYMPLSGGTFSGKINLPSRSTTSQRGFFNLGTCSDGVLSPSGTLVEGDVYFFDNNPGVGATEIKIGYSAKGNSGVVTHFGIPSLNQYNVFTNNNVIQGPSTTTLPALRVTQLGNGHSIVVEDSTSPDSDATIIDASGNVGIGVSNVAGAWTADAKFAVKGSTSSIPLVRLTQLGSGSVLVVEDETTPDATPFVIGGDGRVGVGGTVAASASNKVAIYNGNILLTSGFGVIFGLGTTTQTVPYIPSAVAITGGTIDNIIIDGGTF